MVQESQGHSAPRPPNPRNSRYGGPSSPHQPLVHCWLGWASEGTGLGAKAQARQALRYEFRARVGQKGPRDLVQSPLLGKESQKSKEVETKLTPNPVYPVGKPLARRLEGWDGDILIWSGVTLNSW